MTQPPPMMQSAYAPPPPPQSNVPAVVSLVCGILGCVPFVTSLIAIVLGFVGLSRAKRPAGTGRGMAIAGLTLGIIGVLGWGVLIGMAIVVRVQERRAQAAMSAQAILDVVARGMHTPTGTQPTAAEKYEILIGEGLQGSGFLISHRGRLWGVCSLHQFDNETPSEFIQLLGDDIVLDPSTVIKQRDVQALGVTKAPSDVQYLSYNSDFTLKEGDEVLVFGAGGEISTGVLTAVGQIGGSYNYGRGPRTLQARLTTPMVANGASGGPVILKRTGAVIGVLLTADDPKKATLVGFETLCLPK